MASSGRRASAVRGHFEPRRPGSRWPPTRATGSTTSSIGRTARRRRGGAKAAAGGRAEEAVSWRPSSTGSNSEGGSTMKAWRALTMLLARGALAAPDRMIAAAEGQGRGGMIRIGMDADNTTMDPHRSTAAVDRQVYNNLYGKLVDIDTRFGLVPQLARSWDIKNGGLTYVFKLRRGVTFHDGTDFNAESVKWNFDRMRDPALASPRRSEIAPVKDVKVVAPYTVEVTLSAPFTPFLSVLSDRAGMVVSRDAVEEYKDDFARNPVGTGPFRFVEWVKDDHLTLRRFDGYWEKGLPHLDEVVYRPIPDSSVRFTAMRTGLSCTFRGCSEPARAMQLRITRAQIMKIAVNWRMVLYELDTMLADSNSHNFVALRLGWSGRPDPDGNAHAFLHSKGGLNRVRYANPRMDERLDQEIGRAHV